METIRWGVLSTADIGLQKVIPATQKAQHCEVVAISSQSLEKAQQAATTLGIAKAYGSYDELLQDPDIDAIYNPLPNHLHIEWTQKALLAGKHVLCEKPFCLSPAELKPLIQLQQDTGLLVSEAFMIKAAPQWRQVLNWVREGSLGEVQAIQASFFYRNLHPANIRNRAETLGGTMMDIGCYPLIVARMVFDAEPQKVMALMDIDPEFKTDRLTSAILQFEKGQCTFTAGTQTNAFQRVTIFGTEKHLEVRIPFNAPNDRKTQVWMHEGDVLQPYSEVIEFDVCDQYTAQAEDFAKAIMEARAPLMPLSDSANQAAAIEALFASAKSGAWESPKHSL